MSNELYDENGRLVMNAGYEVSDKDRYSRNISNRLGDIVSLKRVDFPTKASATIHDGAITRSSDLMAIDTENAAITDDLIRINGGNINDKLILSSFANGRSVVVKNGSNNIFLSGSDFTLDSTRDKLQLIKAENDEWHEVSRSNNG